MNHQPPKPVADDDDDDDEEEAPIVLAEFEAVADDDDDDDEEEAPIVLAEDAKDEQELTVEQLARKYEERELAIHQADVASAELASQEHTDRVARAEDLEREREEQKFAVEQKLEQRLYARRQATLLADADAARSARQDQHNNARLARQNTQELEMNEMYRYEEERSARQRGVAARQKAAKIKAIKRECAAVAARQEAAQIKAFERDCATQNVEEEYHNQRRAVNMQIERGHEVARESAAKDNKRKRGKRMAKQRRLSAKSQNEEGKEEAKAKAPPHASKDDTSSDSDDGQKRRKRNVNLLAAKGDKPKATDTDQDKKPKAKPKESLQKGRVPKPSGGASDSFPESPLGSSEDEDSDGGPSDDGTPVDTEKYRGCLQFQVRVPGCNLHKSGATALVLRDGHKTRIRLEVCGRKNIRVTHEGERKTVEGVFFKSSTSIKINMNLISKTEISTAVQGDTATVFLRKKKFYPARLAIVEDLCNLPSDGEEIDPRGDGESFLVGPADPITIN
jgi:hypothetical protein